ncbi:MAG: hypothetical protein JSU71_13890 [Betaproteobacteria bacterium]|nr:MAG: hypothetical protein JSU71_13890 [Betaproteobacteria bacterium]
MKRFISPRKAANGRQLDDLRAIEVLGQLRERLVVIAGLVPRDELGPFDHGLLALTEKRTLEIAVGTQSVELLLGPSCRSPNQAIVLYSVAALVERRDFDHCQRTGPRVELAAKTVLLEHGLQRQKKPHNCGRMGKHAHRIGNAAVEAVRRLECSAHVFCRIVVLNKRQPCHAGPHFNS